IVVKYWVLFLIASDAGLVTWTMRVAAEFYSKVRRRSPRCWRKTCSVSSRPPLRTRKSLSSFCPKQPEPQAKM
ncbi:unnamed protein product, partial [Ectocarpus sp. 8 AP-2014]